MFLHVLGIQLTYNEPFVYGSNIPVSLESNFPHLIAAARNERVKVAPWFHQQEIISLAGQTFYSFAKAGKFDKGGANKQTFFQVLFVLIPQCLNKKSLYSDYGFGWADINMDGISGWDDKSERE